MANAIGTGIVDVIKTGATYLLTFKGSKAATHVAVDADGNAAQFTVAVIKFRREEKPSSATR